MCTIVLVNTNNRAAIDEIETQETQRTDYYDTVEFHANHILRQEKKFVKFWIFSTQFVDFQMTINFVRTDDAKKSQLSSFLFVLHGLFDQSIFINGAFWCIFKWSICIFLIMPNSFFYLKFRNEFLLKWRKTISCLFRSSLVEMCALRSQN